jgi:hypothetical protein
LTPDKNALISDDIPNRENPATILLIPEEGYQPYIKNGETKGKA